MPIMDENNIDNFHKPEWSGRIQHRDNKKGTNIVQHVLTNLDDSSEYRLKKDGTVMVRDRNFKDGKFKTEKKFIPLAEHNRRHYPKAQNPLNKIDHKKLRSRDEISI